MSITKDEWLKALDDAGVSMVNDQSAVTAIEFAAMFGVSTPTAGRRLRALVAAGGAHRTQKRTTAADGRVMVLPAYRLVEKKAKR